jgi:hypothetical protein
VGRAEVAKAQLSYAAVPPDYPQEWAAMGDVGADLVHKVDAGELTEEEAEAQMRPVTQYMVGHARLLLQCMGVPEAAV